MGDVYQRLLGAASSLDPGQWTKDARIEAQAVIRCASCGGIDGLGAEHEIGLDGRVVPAWRCPTVTCGNVSWLWLEAWRP